MHELKRRGDTEGFDGRGCIVMTITAVFIASGSMLAMIGAGYLALRGAL